MRKNIPLIIAVGLLIAYGALMQRSGTSLSDEPVVLHHSPPQIVMFGTRSCMYCQQAREFFKKHNLPYVEHDIELSDEHRRLFDLLGGRGTPLLIINKEIIHGFDERAVRDAL
jgi:glutaredoxin